MKFFGNILPCIPGVGLIFLLSLCIVSSQSIDYTPFADGAKSLFIGHSFFVPIASTFDDFTKIAPRGLWPNHDYAWEFSGGASGAPGALWDNIDHRTNITQILSSGEVELFGMTSGPRDDADGTDIDMLLEDYENYLETGELPPFNKLLEDYKKWIDLALSYKSDTSIFIGMPWSSQMSLFNSSLFDGLTDFGTLSYFTNIITPLRNEYADTQIMFISYGKTASTMRLRYENNDLPGILKLVGRDDSAALFYDDLGHAGPMLKELCAVVWLSILYGADSMMISLFARRSEWDEESVLEIIDEVLDVNSPFLENPTNPPIGAPVGSPIGSPIGSPVESPIPSPNCPSPPHEPQYPYEPFGNGAKCLFIGHSYFVPIGNQFNILAEKDSSRFPENEFAREFSGGESGAPGALWNDSEHFRNINNTLAIGETELFGMTVGGSSESLEEDYLNWKENCVYPLFDDELLQDYTQWIDLALSYKNDTTIYIGLPWIRYAPQMNTTIFVEYNNFGAAAIYDGLIKPLRDIYPETRIVFAAYSKTASTMRARFDDGLLSDIDTLVGPDRNALFKDEGGHAGPMLKELCAVIWLSVLYGMTAADLDIYKESARWDRYTIEDIINEVLEFNEPFQHAT